jgi:hypothetical protein
MKRSELKRGESKLKRTPLKQGAISLSRKGISSNGKGLKRGKRLRFRSKKMEEKYVDRRALVERLLEDRPWCEACLVYSNNDYSQLAIQKATDLHEIVNRSGGGDILDESIIVVVCPTCHARIGEDPKEAERLGLHLRRVHYDDEHVAEAQCVRESLANGSRDVFPSYWLTGGDNG